MLLDIKCNFLLIFSDNSESSIIQAEVNKHVRKAQFLSNSHSTSGDNGIEQTHPHIVLAKTEEVERDNFELAKYLVTSEKFKKSAIIFVGEIPQEKVFIDEMESGKVQFLNDIKNESELKNCLSIALLFAKSHDDNPVNLKFLSSGEKLISFGDTPKYIYIVNSGSLEASVVKDGNKTVLGTIGADEFIGEMAYFNDEFHSADVIALTKCELIEMPLDMIDEALLKNPSLAKALMQTLTHRIKKANQLINKPE